MNDTTSPAYWLDTNTLIESMKRWYRFDMVPGFWSFVDEKVEEGIICSPVKVYDELVDKVDDDLAQWAKQREGPPFFREPDQSVQNFVGNIANHVLKKYKPTKAAKDLLDGADVWLIAYAAVHGGTVVTLEAGAVPGKLNKVRIPLVCDDVGVDWVSLFDMCEALGMKLG